MDNKKKYNEALERARVYRDNARAVGDYAAVARYENIFPELRESEDERITRAINNMLPFIPDKAYANNGVTKEGVLNWLEKQKEQKPVDYYHEMWKNCEANFEGGKKEVIEHPEKYGLQKPAEWSEEDEKMRNLAIEWAETMYGQFRFVDMGSTDFRKIVAWLKSLRPQPKIDWTDEDEKPFNDVLNGLKYAHEDLINHKSFDSAKDIKEAFDWMQARFKSLRPQPKKKGIVLTEEQEKKFGHLFSYPHWKPSEEQMDALKELIDDAHRDGWVTPGATELYEQLKKL